MIAAAAGIYRREDKPFWWGHFDRPTARSTKWSTPSGFLADHATSTPTGMSRRGRVNSSGWLG